eukprot:2416130-Pyramimonas_sp.AAC.2
MCNPGGKARARARSDERIGGRTSERSKWHARHLLKDRGESLRSDEEGGATLNVPPSPPQRLDRQHPRYQNEHPRPYIPRISQHQSNRGYRDKLALPKFVGLDGSHRGHHNRAAAPSARRGGEEKAGGERFLALLRGPTEASTH